MCNDGKGVSSPVTLLCLANETKAVLLTSFDFQKTQDDDSEAQHGLSKVSKSTQGT